MSPHKMRNRHEMRVHRRAGVMARDGAHCRACWSTSDLTLDHITPASQGGSKWSMSNLQILCASCNHAKGSS